MKDFYLDKQTLNDLEVFKDHRDPAPSIFSLFNHAVTPGGSSKLKEIMMEPYSDLEILRKRTELFNYLIKHNLQLALRSHQIEAIERYLELNVALLKSNFLDRWYRTISEWYNPTNEYYLIDTGLRQLFNVLEAIHKQFDFNDEGVPALLLEETKQIRELHPVLKRSLPGKMTQARLTSKMDKLCRKTYCDRLLKMIDEIHSLDAYVGIARASEIHNLTSPQYLENDIPDFRFSQLRHPLLAQAQPYDFNLGDDHNMCFLTGPNMAGKSTFLKAIAIGIYLGHLGFPVPAESAEMIVFRGMSTTINLSDNLGLGHSHYFAEVNRVREVTELLETEQPLFIVFDELFRGTNVKDAHEASTAIIGAFAKLPQSAFLVSTHIVEVAEDLKDVPSILFSHFDLLWQDGKPVYSYQMKPGVSSERLGMYILEDAGVMEKLQKLID